MNRFNTNPYFDDFDPKKNFHKILFRGGRPVQARELNQIQSILKNQIKEFANHIFKNGTVVSEGRVNLRDVEYVRLYEFPVDLNSDDFIDHAEVDVESLSRFYKVIGEVSGITAKTVININAEGNDPPTIYVVYTGVANDGETKRFVPGENILFYDANNTLVYKARVRCPSCVDHSTISPLNDSTSPTGTGKVFTVDDGVYYFDGTFINSHRQEIVVEKYNNFVLRNTQIGFVADNEIVTFKEDASLLDPSLGYPNSTSPGADRHQITLRLNKFYDNVTPDEFILLCEIKEGRVNYKKTDSEYADIMDMIARRTYEQAGNYTVNPFKVRFLNHRKGGTNDTSDDTNGWLSNGNDDWLVAIVSQGLAYVKGYRCRKVDESIVTFDKARDTKDKTNFTTRFDERTYILLKPVSEVVWPNHPDDRGLLGLRRINFYDGLISGNNPGGSIIGSCLVSDIQLIEGQTTNNTAKIKYYVYDIQMNAGKTLREVRSVHSSDANFLAHIVPDRNGDLTVHNANRKAFLSTIQRNHIRSLRRIDNNENGSINIYLRKKLVGLVNSSGYVVFNSVTNELFTGFNSKKDIGWLVHSGSINALDLNISMFTIDPTELKVNIGTDHIGKTFVLITDILAVNQREKGKSYRNKIINTHETPVNVVGTKIYLTRADAWRLNSVHIFDTINGTDVEDVTDHYAFHKNISDYAYNESYIEMIKEFDNIVSGHYRLRIDFDYLHHTGSSAFFNIDSYRNVFNDTTNPITYDNIESYISNANNEYHKNNSMDFRPVVLIDQTNFESSLPVMGSNMIFDIQYYLPRTDLLQIDKNNVLYISKGIPSESPRPPKQDVSSMALYEIHLQPYTYSLDDISTRFIDNRRYTMRDIGRLDSRIRQVEYYVALNLLEQSTLDMDIKDINGLDRFKNGFLVDNFREFKGSDLKSNEFRAALNRKDGFLRPRFKSQNRKLLLSDSESSNYTIIHDDVVMLPYEEEVFSENPYATKHISINPYLQYVIKGDMTLDPIMDVWSDDNRLPQVVTDIDAGVDAFTTLADASGVLGTNWGSWVEQNRTIIDNTTGRGEIGDVIDITRIVEERTGRTGTVETQIQSYSIEDVVKDVSIIPYMREIIITIHVNNLKPNKKIWLFIEGGGLVTNITQYTQSLISLFSNSLEPSIDYENDLYTDGNGESLFEVHIPGGMFFVGQKKFFVSDDKSGTRDEDIETTYAEALFFAGGLDLDKQNHTLNIHTPKLVIEESVEERDRETFVRLPTTTLTSTTTATTTTTTTTTTPTLPPGSGDNYLFCLWRSDDNRNAIGEPIMPISFNQGPMGWGGVEALMIGVYVTRNDLDLYHNGTKIIENIATNGQGGNITGWQDGSFDLSGYIDTKHGNRGFTIIQHNMGVTGQTPSIIDGRHPTTSLGPFVALYEGLHNLGYHFFSNAQRDLPNIYELRDKFGVVIDSVECEPIGNILPPPPPPNPIESDCVSLDQWAFAMGIIPSMSDERFVSGMMSALGITREELRTGSFTGATLEQVFGNTTGKPICPETRVYDPVAQGFVSDEDSFVTAFDIYLKQLDLENEQIWFEVRNMVNGYPGKEILSRKDYNVNDIQHLVSDDSTVTFHVKLDYPVYIEGGVEYCFVVGGYSPNSRIWVARLGDEVVDQPGKIVETSPTFMPSFRSLNSSTWNAEQFETIKYKAYRCVFNSDEMNLTFYNSPNNKVVLNENPFEMQAGSGRVRVHFKNHGFTEGDKVKFDLLEDNVYNLYIEEGEMPYVGQTIVFSGNNRGTITSARKDLGTHFNSMVSISGLSAVPSGTFVIESSTRPLGAQSLLTANSSKLATSGLAPQLNGSLVDIVTRGDVFDNNRINGIRSESLLTEQTIIEVDSMDSFIITLPEPALDNGYYGGKLVKVNGYNEKYDIFNVSGDYLLYNNPETWTLRGIGHGTNNSPFSADNYQLQAPREFETGSDHPLSQPYKIAGGVNEIASKSVKIEGRFSGTRLVSPVFNVDSFSLTTISNRIEWLDESVYNTIPNQSGRYIEETDPNQGSEQFKWISKDVYLNSPANDLLIMFGAYKHQMSDFEVYIKRLRQSDVVTLDNKEWERFSNIDKLDTALLDDIREYELQASHHINNWFDTVHYGGEVDEMVVTDGGAGYTTATVTIDTGGSPGSGATADAIINFGRITGINITNPGSGYENPPLVIISGDGAGARAIARITDIMGDAEPFIAYKVKLVGKSLNSSQPILFESLRTIAFT